MNIRWLTRATSVFLRDCFSLVFFSEVNDSSIVLNRSVWFRVYLMCISIYSHCYQLVNMCFKCSSRLFLLVSGAVPSLLSTFFAGENIFYSNCLP